MSRIVRGHGHVARLELPDLVAVAAQMRLRESPRPHHEGDGRADHASREDLLEAAQRTLLEAERRAAAIVAEAETGADRIREEARAAGHAAGYADGHAAATEAVQAAAEAERAQYRADIEAFLGLIERERQRIWAQAEPSIVRLVLETAQKVVKDDAQVNREVALSVIRNALRRVTETDRIRIRVNVDDLATVRSTRDDLAALVDGIRHLEIVEDRRVGAGGAVVETSSGAIDARIATQFAEIETAFEHVAREAA
ncbi:MAG TPA: FliH/SctL family protein [Chthonomonadales bacterium]|nr:FliH/SctL family protein [Chthonomonadales bacterium]